MIVSSRENITRVDCKGKGKGGYYAGIGRENITRVDCKVATLQTQTKVLDERI